MAQNYYDTLGVSKNASADEIKQAYRKLAREWHPDVAKDKAGAEAKFKEINEAYQVLSDPQRKSQYDQFGSSYTNGATGAGAYDQQQGNPFGGFSGFGGNGFQWSYSSGGADNIDPFDIFEQVFGFRGFGGSRKGRDVRYSLAIDLKDAVKGMEETIEVDGHKLKIKIPSGIREGTQIKFAGKGEKPNDGREPGDLYISISIKPLKDLARQGDDIISIEDITIKQAILGDKIDIKVVDPESNSGFSNVKLKIPAGTQFGTRFRIKAKGMPRMNGYGRGDHYVTVRVDIPKKISKQQKEALNDLF